MTVCQETVDVRSGPEVDEPSMFVWRGRLYVVRQVLAHRREWSPWWRAVSGATGADEVGAGSSFIGPAVVWRVRASAGRELGTATYDLVRPLQSGAPAWVLVRVVDRDG